MYIIVSIGYF